MDTTVPPQTTEFKNEFSNYTHNIVVDVTYINNYINNDNDINKYIDNDVLRPTTPDQPTDKTMPDAPKKIRI
jgi:hypothetical protein